MIAELVCRRLWAKFGTKKQVLLLLVVQWYAEHPCGAVSLLGQQRLAMCVPSLPVCTNQPFAAAENP